jgi:hypothetical protein
MMGELTYHIVQDAEYVQDEIKQIFGDSFVYRDIKGIEGGDLYNFVGFIMKGEQMLISFPKHYMSRQERKELAAQPEKLRGHLQLLFKCVQKITNKLNDRFVGLRKEFSSFYPFEAYFQVYEYFRKYGLFTNEKVVTYYGYSGKVSWRDTMRKSPIVVDNGNILYMPMVMRKRVEEHVFISKCMAYVIDSTLQKFSMFLEGQPTDLEYRDIDFNDKNFIISQLHNAKRTFFKDIHIRLINALIAFFEKEKNEGGSSQLKIYTFNLIWEDMVNNYLNKRFIGIGSEGRLQFGPGAPVRHFEKAVIKNADVKTKGTKYRIEPDHYLVEGDTRYIFDAKYYLHDKELNYKQVAYYFLMKHFQAKDEDGNIKPLKTYNALILPTEENDPKSEHHFRLNPEFNLDDPDFQITTQYLNTIDVMKNYI